MAEEMQLAVPDWIFLGDYSRYVFLNWLTGMAQAGETGGLSIWVQYGEAVSIRQQNSSWWITSPLVIPGMTLLLPSSEEELSQFQLQKRTRFALFEEFPYGKQSTHLTRQLLRQNYEGSSVLVVLMDIPCRQGSTDLLQPGEDLHVQYEEYRKCENVCVASGARDVLRVLHWEEDLEQTWRRQANLDLEHLQSLIEDVEYDYQMLQLDFVESILSEQTMDRICSFQSVRRSRQSSIWKGYTKAALRQMFPASGSGGLYPVVELYKDILSAFSPILWDFDRDSLELLKTMKGEMETVLSAPELSEVKLNPQTEDAYYQAVSEYKLNGTFRKRLEHFVDQAVLDILKQHLQLRYNQLEEALS